MSTTKKITAEDVAEYFIALSNETGDTMTNLRLQKLVFYAQAWYLANFNKPLFEEDFQAWVHGPVIPTIYNKYKERGGQPILSDLKLNQTENIFDETTREFLKEVSAVYMPYTAYQLESMTHNEDPWVNARKGLKPTSLSDKIIEKEDIRKYYEQKIKI